LGAPVALALINLACAIQPDKRVAMAVPLFDPRPRHRGELRRAVSFRDADEPGSFE
jgi:hypothetical protein